MAVIIEQIGKNDVFHRIVGGIYVSRHVENVIDAEGIVTGTREVALVTPASGENGDETKVRSQIQKLHGVPVRAIISNDDGLVNGEANTKILPDTVAMTILVMNFRFLSTNEPRIPTTILPAPVAA